mgnify:CR=1 FL=1
MVMRKMTALLTFVLIICLLPAAAFAKTFKEGDKDWKIMVTQQKLKTWDMLLTVPTVSSVKQLPTV